MAQSMTNSEATEVSVSGATDNRSYITVKAIFNKTSTEYASDNPEWKIYVNGSVVNSGTYNFARTDRGDMTIGTWSGYIAHNADGTGSCTWECKFEGNKHPIAESSWFTSGQQTLTLTTINRNFSVSYNINGGNSTVPSTQSGRIGTSITLAGAASHANGLTSRTTYISYNSNGGSGSMTASSGTQSGSYPINFNKWALNSTSGTQYSAGGSFTIPDGNSTMYATWSNGSTTYSNVSIALKSNSFTKSASASRTTSISYNSNGGSGSMTATSGTQTGTTTYPFSKWALGSTGGTQYSAGTSVSISGDTTAYAIWGSGSTSYNNISLTLAANTFTKSASASRTISISYNANGGTGTTNATSGTQTGTTTYPFSKWALGSTSGTQYTAGTSVSIASSTTAYAIWGTGSTSYNNLSLTLASNSFTHANGSTSKTVTISYNANGGSGTMTASTGTSSGSYPITFSKWALGSTSGTQYTAGTSVSISDSTTAYAIWTNGSTTWANTDIALKANTFTKSTSVSKTITVSYNANGGSGTMTASTGACVGTTTYPFSKWAMGSTSGTQYDAGTNYSTNTDTTAYAIWGTGTTTYNDTTITLRSNSFTKSGYDFIGWNTEADGSGTAYTTSYTGQTDKTLYAQWASAGSVRYYNGTSIVGPYMPYVWNGTEWVFGIAYVWNGTAWKQGE